MTWDSTANTERLRILGDAVGDALIALFDAGPNGLTVSVKADAFWRSLWDVVSQPVYRLRQFLERLGWRDDENGTVHDRSRSIYEFVAEHHPDVFLNKYAYGEDARNVASLQ